MESVGRAEGQVRKHVELSDSPSIYVASLSDYNDGELHGRWIDATQGVDHINDEVQAMLETSPYAASDFAWIHGLKAEEWAIHDYSGFGKVRLSEWESFEKVAEMAEKIEEHGDAFLAYLEHFDSDESDGFEERYQGEWQTVEDFAEEWTENTGGLENVPENIRGHIAWSSVAAEMGIDGFTFILGGEGVYVFTTY